MNMKLGINGATIPGADLLTGIHLARAAGFSHHAFPALALAREVAGASGLPLVLDTFHLAVSGTPIQTIQEMEAGDIELIHLSDAIVGDHSLSDISDTDRVLPGKEGFRSRRLASAALYPLKYSIRSTNASAQARVRWRREPVSTQHSHPQALLQTKNSQSERSVA